MLAIDSGFYPRVSRSGLLRRAGACVFLALALVGVPLVAEAITITRTSGAIL